LPYRLDPIAPPAVSRHVAAGVEGPLLALIRQGSFDMGSTAAPEEQPVHHVTIQEPFAISVYEVRKAN